MTPAIPRLLLLLVLGAAAQTRKWPIESLAVEGLERYTPQQVIAASGLRLGQVAGKEEFDVARDRLVATGVFETVGYRFAAALGQTGYAASFQVVEVKPAYPVRFERFKHTAEEITAHLRRNDPFFGEKIPATDVILKRHSAAIGALAGEKAAGRVVADGPGEFTIVFSPAAREPAVAEVRFEGNEVIPGKLLLTNFAGVAYGVPFREPAFRQMLDASIRPLYEARGRIRVSFG
ncbi:MAG: hypothetical protein ACRD96_27930, partial [Bryobacteraceae bacterium]